MQNHTSALHMQNHRFPTAVLTASGDEGLGS